MRIVAGRFRRRKLDVNPGLVTRPITDRVKEMLFAHLESEISGRRIADIFAGTGTIGLEALSRGAGGVVFFENNRRAFNLLKQNIDRLGVDEETLCWRVDVRRTSFRPKGVPHLLPFDVVFFDPPYRMVEELRPGLPLFKSLLRLGQSAVTSTDALLVLRTPRDARFELPPCWIPDRVLKPSTMEIHLIRKQKMDEQKEDGL